MVRVMLLLVIALLPLFGRAVKDQSEVLNDAKEPVGFIEHRTYIEPPMVTVKAGSFIMGSTLERDEQPLREVRIAYDYDIGVYEVTFDEYDRFCKAIGIKCPDDHGWGRGKRPVIGVNWKDAKEYTKWLSEKSGKQYRLPSEAEWEYAVRAGTTTPFSFGSDIKRLDAYAWHEFNAGNVTHVVGQKEANPLGLYDVYGNAWEWCEDGYERTYEEASTDGTAVRGGLKKVLRGGGYGSYADHMRSAKRFKLLQFLRSKKNGFRLVRER